MARIKNTTDRPLGFGGVTIQGGAIGTIPDNQWRTIKNGNVVKQWLASNIIIEEEQDALPGMPGGLPGLPGLPGVEPTEDQRKQQIIDELATFGITKTMRSSLASLEMALVEAKNG